MELPETFMISLPERYGELLNGNGGDRHGLKAHTVRIALREELPRLDGVAYVVASRRIVGPFKSKFTVVPHADFWEALTDKSQELGVDKSSLARVALCLFLDRVQAAENKEVTHEQPEAV